jgi:hypothetical protein
VEFYAQSVVQPDIPNTCMTPIECWLLNRIFESEPIDDRVYFFAKDSPNFYAEIDEHLTEALKQTRAAKLSIELCDAIDAKLRDPSVVEDGSFDLEELGGYERVLQDICKRYPDQLRYVTVEQSFTCTRMAPDAFGGAITLITPDGIHSISTQEWLDTKLIELGLKKERRSL